MFDYIYAAGSGSIVKEYNRDTLTLNNQFPSDSATIYGLIEDDEFIYTSNYSGFIKKYSKQTHTLEHTSPDYGGMVRALVIVDDFIYAGGKEGIVKKYNKSNLSFHSASVDFGSEVYTITTDGVCLFIGSKDNVKKISFDLDLLATSSYYGTINGLKADSNYIYIATSLKYLKRLSKEDLSEDGSVLRNEKIESLVADDAFIYIGDYAGHIYKYNKDLSFVCESDVQYGGRAYAIAQDTSYVYVGGYTVYDIKKYNKTNLAYISSSPSYGGSIYALSILSDSMAGITISNPSKTFNSLALSWTSVDDTSYYILKHKKTSESTYINTTTTGLNEIIYGLDPSTSYDVTVESYNVGDVKTGEGGGQFSTLELPIIGDSRYTVRRVKSGLSIKLELPYTLGTPNQSIVVRYKKNEDDTFTWLKPRMVKPKDTIYIYGLDMNYTYDVEIEY